MVPNCTDAGRIHGSMAGRTLRRGGYQPIYLRPNEIRFSSSSEIHLTASQIYRRRFHTVDMQLGCRFSNARRIERAGFGDQQV
jgi:hypothetical protein